MACSRNFTYAVTLLCPTERVDDCIRTHLVLFAPKDNVKEDRLDLRVAWGTFYVHYSVVDVQIQMV